ncbi:hypothetical protein [Halocatena marina]|uniref:hypothetical protein n=1 Tax=Halocatena marina TaxID=2934937 RepID=UPI00200E580B|nr:hypothetical protein [Halocatena marina]
MSKTTTLLDLVCAQRKQIQVILALIVSMGLFLMLSVLFVGPGDQSFPILVIDIILVIGTFIFFSVTYWFCTKRAMDN